MRSWRAGYTRFCPMVSPRAKRIASWIAVSAGAVTTIGVLGVGATLWWHARGISRVDETTLRNYRPPQVTRVMSRDGALIGELFSERRTVVDYARIPSHVENAFLAAEDAQFHEHEGMDYFGMVRALVANVKAGQIRQGASTITQQVVKIFMLSSERTFERKVQELVLARRLEQALSKREILELYLNEIYLGHGCYGIEEASRFYFGTGVADISLGQAAILAGLPKAPSRDSPVENPEGAKKRQVYVLEQMVKLGWASAHDAQAAIDGPLDVVDRAAVPRVAPGAEEFVDLARADLIERYGEDALDTLGATVVTTVDLELQSAARESLRQGLRALDLRQGYGHGNKPATEKKRDRALAKGTGDLSVGEVRPVVVISRPAGVELPPDGFAGRVGDRNVFVRVPRGSRYDEPDVTMEEQFPPESITMVRLVGLAGPAEGVPAGWARGEIGSGPEAAVVLSDVRTGEILAMIGGYAHARGQFNRALQARRQPGSSFKPFVYGAALESREFTAASIVSDSPEIYEKWKPTNFEADQYRGDIRVRQAMTHSVNTVAIKLLDAIGYEAVHRFARAAGIESELANNLSLALGTSEVTPRELLGAYQTLARGGSRLSPRGIVRIEIAGEKPVDGSKEPEDALSADVVFVLTSMMQSVVEEGTGKGARALGRPVAGKTGTSGDHRDAWFAGFTPRHAAVVWVGFDTPRRIGRSETGGRAALPIWLGAMGKAEGESTGESFVPPPSVTVRTIDAASGLLAPTGTMDGDLRPTLEEFFLEGTEPVEEATPEALPAGDVLLDLYGAEPEPAYPSPESRLDEAPPLPPPLPSVDDEPADQPS